MASSRLVLRRLFSTGKVNTSSRTSTSTNFQRPPTYKDQIEKGIPFGKRKVYGNERQVVLQTVVGITIFCGFVAAPFIGKKLAQQDAKVLQWVPWADFTVSKHFKTGVHVNTKEDFHRSMIDYQREMHQRAINGEFADGDATKKIGTNTDVNATDAAAVENSVYWRPNLSDGPRDPGDDDDEDDEGDEED